MTGETIASLGQKLTPDTEEDMTAEDDVDLAKANGEADAEGNEQEPNGNRKGPSGEDKSKGLDATQHAPSGEEDKGASGNVEGEKGDEGGKPKPKGRYKLIEGRNLATLVDDIVKWGRSWLRIGTTGRSVRDIGSGPSLHIGRLLQ